MLALEPFIQSILFKTQELHTGGSFSKVTVKNNLLKCHSSLTAERQTENSNQWGDLIL